MSMFRNALPQLNGQQMLTDGGLESTLVFHQGIDLPCFAAFVLLESDDGQHTLKQYFDRYLKISAKYEIGFVLESVTWRANRDWGQRIGYSVEQLKQINKQSIEFLTQIQRENADTSRPMPISGCIGPRGDGYIADQSMNPEQAASYHALQAEIFADSDADMISAMTMTNADEVIGITLASQRVKMPVAISFTVETDGRLPSGQTLGEAIQQVDEATDFGPAYYMINCAHPSHFSDTLHCGEPWVSRLGGLRANASRRSHEELEQMEELDEGDPNQLGAEHRTLLDSINHSINVLGGCCGTDHRHVEAICASVFG